MTSSIVCSGTRQDTTMGEGNSNGRNRSAVNNYVTDGNVEGRRKTEDEGLRPLQVELRKMTCELPCVKCSKDSVAPYGGIGLFKIEGNR
jgi:hypothetical protein